MKWNRYTGILKSIILRLGDLPVSNPKRTITPTFKTVLLGDGAVGKTCLRERFMGKEFSADYYMTIGADFAVKKVVLPEFNKTVVFQIWDLAGQPRFEAVRGLYYQGSHGALLIFDVTRRESFENTPFWIQECWKNAGRRKVPLVMLGNKCDLRDHFDFCVSEKEGLALAEKLSEILGFPVPYLETSALSGLNVSNAFISLGEIIEKYKDEIKPKR